MTSQADPDITEPRRIRNFAVFFKSYMNVFTFVVAALPLPVGWAKLIPMYRPDAGSTSVIASLLCFLLLSYIFYSRQSVARVLFQDVHGTTSASSGRNSQAERVERSLRYQQWLRRTMFSVLVFALILGAAVLFFLYQLTWMRSEQLLIRAEGGGVCPPISIPRWSGCA